VGHLLDDIFFSDDEENAPRPRLPLFSRCPLTNRAQLETPSSSSGGKMKSASLRYALVKQHQF
jgi:hypothetical protein